MIQLLDAGSGLSHVKREDNKKNILQDFRMEIPGRE
jgi:hypothetical protein